MRNRTRKVNSISDLLKHLKRDLAGYKGQIWFRGHGVSDWKLLPAHLRTKGEVSEFTLFTRFKQNATLLIEKPPRNNFDWLFQMQHHGISTRLLDWTESPLAGLYFGIEDSQYKNKDGALWILLPTELNKHANIISSEEFYIPSFEDEDTVGNYDPLKVDQEQKTELLPVAAIASRNNTRMQAQLGVFTISHRDKTPIEEIGDKKHIWKYIIPNEKKSEIKKELAMLSITKFQLFPELSNIIEIIKQDL